MGANDFVYLMVCRGKYGLGWPLMTCLMWFEISRDAKGRIENVLYFRLYTCGTKNKVEVWVLHNSQRSDIGNEVFLFISDIFIAALYAISWGRNEKHWWATHKWVYREDKVEQKEERINNLLDVRQLKNKYINF